MDPVTAGALLKLAKRFWLPALLLSALVVQTVRLDGFLWIDGALDKLATAEFNLREVRAEIKAISDKRNEQGETTKGNLDKAETIRDKADDKAREIEDAPTAPNCETPQIIMESDI